MGSSQSENMQQYYRLHAHIYEYTRWAFLFGRKKILSLLALKRQNDLHLMEIGCGTGYNLAALADAHPKMRLTGIDVSPEMLAVAQKKVAAFKDQIQLFRLVYGTEKIKPSIAIPDIILISYCLTMINPGWEKVIATAARNLLPDGRVAVVDFHYSPFSWFSKWMGYNHVRLDAQLVPLLKQQFETEYFEEIKAYGGLWTYFIFIGKYKNPV